jgi:hypothetical protein
MKFSIEGFSQEVLVNMGLDHADALILQWFSDFQSTGKMKNIDDPRGGYPYQWVLYRTVIDDLPCLGITNSEVVARRFKKLCNAGALESLVYKRGKTLTCYRKGQYFTRLLYGALDSKVDQGSTQKSMALDSKVDPKTLLLDSSIKIKDCACADEEEIPEGFDPTSVDLMKAIFGNKGAS